MTTTVIRAGSAVRVEVDDLPVVAPFEIPGVVNASTSIISDTPLTVPISINGIPSQYYRTQNHSVYDGFPGSTNYGSGLLAVRWSNDTKGVEDTICKSRGTTIGSMAAIQAGDAIYTQLWYGASDPALGNYMAHIGQFKVAIDGAPLGDPTELPGWLGWYTGTGQHSPGSRIAMEINSKQQVHFPGPLSSALGPTGASFGANVLLGVGAAAAGSAPLKLIPAAAVLLTVPESGAVEVDSAGVFYVTNAAGVRRQIVDASTENSTIAAGVGAGTGPTIAIDNGPNCGTITLTTGTTPTLGGLIASVTFAHAYPAASYPAISPANDAAAGVVANVRSVGSTIGFTLKNVTTALAASTQYVWNFQVNGK